jgi:hypothetical protein
MTFDKWRQQLRFMQARRLRAEGAKVTRAAVEAGYSAKRVHLHVPEKTRAHAGVVLQDRHAP